VQILYEKSAARLLNMRNQVLQFRILMRTVSFLYPDPNRVSKPSIQIRLWIRYRSLVKTLILMDMDTQYCTQVRWDAASQVQKVLVRKPRLKTLAGRMDRLKSPLIIVGRTLSSNRYRTGSILNSVPDPDPPGSEIIWPQGSLSGSYPFSHQT